MMILNMLFNPQSCVWVSSVINGGGRSWALPKYWTIHQTGDDEDYNQNHEDGNENDDEDKYVEGGDDEVEEDSS